MLAVFKILVYIFVQELILVYGNVDTRLIQGTNLNLEEALQFLREYDAEASNMCFRVKSAQWLYSTNMTDINKRRMIEEQMLKAKFEKLSWKKAITFDWNKLPDPIARRQLRFLITNGRASLSDEKYNEIHHLISEMKDIYSSVRVCPFNNTESNYCDLVLEPDVSRIMKHSRSPDELEHIWKEWHDKTGPPLKNKFMRYVQLANQAARLNGFLDAGEQLRHDYEDDNFEYELAETWQTLQPLYKELFTYVRRKLILKYGSEIIRPDGPIPAHLVGNVWAQDWTKIGNLLTPYNIGDIDVTDEMLKKGFNSLRIFQLAEEFLTSMGLRTLPPEFWRNSLIEKPADRKVQCTASSWDFCNKIDYRIKQCTEVNTDFLLSTHREMGHLQYYMHYADQPFLFREGANPGFHEGFSSAIVLSVFNPNHLERIQLYKNNSNMYEKSINFLMKIALDKVAYAPYALLIDQWRYHVYKDGITTMNEAWWNLRLRYQGIIPPVHRTESQLDAAAKRHIIADIPYTKYYVGLILEFQIFEALCSASGQTSGQLHMCDLSKSREAGRIISDALKIGRSKHWRDVLRVISNGREDRLSANSMVNYFQPLMKWLKAQNRDEQIIGWITNDDDTKLFHPLLLKSSSSFSYQSSTIFLFLTTFALFIVEILY